MENTHFLRGLPAGAFLRKAMIILIAWKGTSEMTITASFL